MAITTEAQRWAIHALASGGPAIRNTVFNPETSGVVAIERATVLRICGSVAWANPTPSTASKPPSGLALLGMGT